MANKLDVILRYLKAGKYGEPAPLEELFDHDHDSFRAATGEDTAGENNG
jgi:hypothetical protein